MLRSFEVPSDERLITSWDCGEDAALWKIDENRVGILTLDFITPVVDDPGEWGEIAAANAIGDVFAMGGKPFIALNIVAFPINCLPVQSLKELMDGGYRKVRESGAFLVGGHSVEDQEPKYGLCVFGEVEADCLWKVTGAMAGDKLILTKPLGAGIMVTGIKADMVEDQRAVQEGVKWMRTLNDLPLKMPKDLRKEVHSCTDVTGFGFAGHALDMLSKSDLNLNLSMSSLPLMKGTMELAAMGLVPAGAYANRSLYQSKVDGLEGEDPLQDFLFDPQTSGGLLLAVSPERSEELLEFAIEAGFEKSAIIGEFSEGSGRLVLT
ncbi:selenophosphate synthase [Dethiosulfovibrio salsuginis]|uniref:Selenophosphate synthase n=1 Tax=Dethiosulfovibrio salsuginis TaxID=561720 RepID=A0A1X7I8Z2_9BACT|nr:selenophosphate synthase [Dethiosulfovibrio salsuginis]